MDINPNIPHCTACGEKLRSAENIVLVAELPYCHDCDDFAKAVEEEKQLNAGGSKQ